VRAVTGSTIQLDTPDGFMPTYIASPGGDARGAIVVIQEAFGVNDHIESICDRLADAGYRAAAPHLFHRSGGGTAPYDDFSKVLPMFEGVDDSTFLTDVDAVLDLFGRDGFEGSRIGTVGFCMGGRVSFLIAVRRTIGAAVGFYGGGIVTARFPQFPALIGESAGLATPWLGLFGDLDTGIPVEDVESLRTALEVAPVDTEIVRYPDAGHGFNCDVRDAYHATSADDAWSRTLAWFDTHLG
jgi:carboxymethylenebutenolidase